MEPLHRHRPLLVTRRNYINSPSLSAILCYKLSKEIQEECLAENYT